MRALFGILLSALVLSGCSPGHTAYLDKTIEVVAGKDIRVGKSVLSVKKREGSSLKGIRIETKESDGSETIATAEDGTIAEGPKQSIESPVTSLKDQNRVRVVVTQKPVTVTLFNAKVQTKTQSGARQVTVERLRFTF